MNKFSISSAFLKPEGKEQMQQQIFFARNQGMTWEEISKSSSISKTTAFRWMNRDISKEAQHDRQLHPRRERILTQEEKDQVVHLAKERREQFQEVTIDWTRQAISNVTNGRVPHASNGYISNFWRDNGWPSRKTQERNQKEIRTTLEEEMNQFRSEVTQYVNEHNIPPSRVHTMDETGLWNGSVAPRTYVNPDTINSGVVSEGNHRRDTGVVSISASGCVHPFFIEHSPQKTQKVNGSKIIKQRGVSGMGLDQMKDWCNEFGEKFGNPEGTVLMLDRLRSHTNKDIQNILESHNVKCFHFPPQ